MTFAIILFIALVFSGVVALIDKLWLRKSRPEGAKEPIVIEYSRSLFPVILIVFVLRSFLVEPFKIPSGSMLPTLLIGDFILVNKYTYGIRLPIISKKIVPLNDPKRGDVMVFRYPNDPSTDYIKRVVGTPGDLVQYRDKRLTINGVAVPLVENGVYHYAAKGLNYVSARMYDETLGEHMHKAMVRGDAPVVSLVQVADFPYRQNCDYNESGFTCRVPEGHYFMLGDNRDDSNDSRYWGFVPDKYVVGKAFLIWFNFSEFSRIGDSIE
jgi:signal peptidase I